LNTEIKTNKYGTNEAIKVHLKPDNEMRKLGFTDYCEGYWYYHKDLNCDISFGLTVNKNDSSDMRIDVLDENFCQPYDYQYFLENNPNFKVALEIQGKVEAIMFKLKEAGILSGHEYGEYI
jgi:hypothetical protein